LSIDEHLPKPLLRSLNKTTASATLPPQAHAKTHSGSFSICGTPGANFVIVNNLGTLTADFEGMLVTVTEMPGE